MQAAYLYVGHSHPLFVPVPAESLASHETDETSKETTVILIFLSYF
jgi:hypothetical protein